MYSETAILRKKRPNGKGKMPVVYAFRPPKRPPLQGFSGVVGRQVGQIIQSPPDRTSKCVEENP